MIQFPKYVSNPLMAIMVLCVIVLGGCMQSQKQIAAKQFYIINADRDGEVQSSCNKTIKVREFTVSTLFQSSGLVYKIGDNQFEIDNYNKLFASAGIMTAQSLREWLGQSELFVGVLESRSSAQSDYCLEGHIIELYGDFSQEQSQATVQMQFVLLDGLGRSKGELTQWKYSQRIVLSDQTPESLIEAYETAFSNIFANLENDLSKKLGN